MNAAQELSNAELLVSEIAEIDDLTASLSSDDVRRRLRNLRRRLIGWVPTVRLSVAASLLDLSVPTVRAWIERGLLEGVADTSPRRVALQSVVEVRPILRELRSLGQDRDLVQTVLARIEDEAVLADPELQRSLDEMHRGELIDVTPLRWRDLPDQPHPDRPSQRQKASRESR
jgi:DNA-binding transcriptional MerR regulator